MDIYMLNCNLIIYNLYQNWKKKLYNLMMYNLY